MSVPHIKAVAVQQELLPDPVKVVPFGRFGGGNLTGHPIGLVIVAALFFMGFVGLPQYRVFLALAVPAGAVCGFLLWYHHRNGLAIARLPKSW